MKLEQKNILITGASRGLGKAISQTCWRHGANLLLVARDSMALETLRGELMHKHAHDSQSAHIFSADLTADDAAEKILTQARSIFPRTDALINNAGILGPVGKAWENDARAWHQAIHVNLLAPVALCHAFVPWMIETRAGSIINLSGGGATSPRPNFSAYASAKTALVRFTEILAVELAGTGVRANTIAPGTLATDMLKDLLAAGRDKVGADEYDKVLKQINSGSATPPERAAELCAFLASDESSAITGKLIAAVWDPWETLPARGDELKSDIYTLRRIVPEDRGKKW